MDARETNELSPFYNPELTDGQPRPNGKDDTAYLIYIDAVRKAMNLRFEAELQALRMQGEKEKGDIRYGETTFRDYVKILFREKIVFLTTFLTLMTAVVVGLKFKTPVYEAETMMLVSAERQPTSPYYKELNGGRNIQAAVTQSEIVTSRPVLERAVTAYKLDERPIDYEKQFASPIKHPLIDFRTQGFREAIQSPEQEKFLRRKKAMGELAQSIDVDPIRDTNMFRIRVRDFDPQEAANLANIVSRSYVIFDLEQQLAEMQTKYGDKHAAVIQLKDNIQAMERNLNGNALSDVDAIGTATVKIIEQASTPTEPVGFSKMLILAGALVLSLLLAIVLAVSFHTMDPTFKSPKDVERALPAPLLGSIPKKTFGRLITKNGGAQRTDLYGRSYQNLAIETYLMAKEKGMKCLLMAASLGNRGTTTMIANLGTHLAGLGHRTLLVDANWRRPELHKKFKISGDSGLADILEGRLDLEAAVWDASDNLSVLAAGKSQLNPYMLLSSSQMRETMAKAKEKYDVILLDCADVRGYKDAMILSQAADGVVIVVNEGSTRRQSLKGALASFRLAKAKILGTILNNRTYAIPSVIYERV